MFKVGDVVRIRRVEDPYNNNFVPWKYSKSIPEITFVVKSISSLDSNGDPYSLALTNMDGSVALPENHLNICRTEDGDAEFYIGYVVKDPFLTAAREAALQSAQSDDAPAEQGV